MKPSIPLSRNNSNSHGYLINKMHPGNILSLLNNMHPGNRSNSSAKVPEYTCSKRKRKKEVNNSDRLDFWAMIDVPLFDPDIISTFSSSSID
jgi:hypothetical protein